jgi:hypothetical protein
VDRLGVGKLNNPYQLMLAKWISTTREESMVARMSYVRISLNISTRQAYINSNAWEVVVSYFPKNKGNVTYPTTHYVPDLDITMFVYF